MLDIYATLEIEKVLEEVRSYAKSELAKEKISSLKMVTSIEEEIYELAKVDEMSSLILRRGNLPIDFSINLANYLELANKGGILTALELDHIASDIITSNRLFEYFRKVEKNLYPKLLELMGKMFDLSFLEKEIHRVISPNLSIYDDASKELSIIRKRIKEYELDARNQIASLINRFSDELSDLSYTLRDGRYVLPFKSSYKNKVSGIIHDVSDSGQTTFIEPSQLVELSNKIYLLKKSEKEEIQKLLKELTFKVTQNSENILINNEIIGELDLVLAKAKYGNETNSYAAKIDEEHRIIDIKGARHPLIKKDVVVENDFLLSEETRMIVISGPNAGGKTVALKTLGLMIMMSQMGLMIPTSTPANISFFPKIYADIGDNQSLSDNLSTFAAHISNLSRITKYVSSNDLVLIDELGTGTSPKEGEAIALASLDYLLDTKCFAIISSHFDKIKEYAFTTKHVVNATMLFDEKKLLPTYKLKIGYPGRSYGIEMATRYHLSDKVVRNAKNRLKESSYSNKDKIYGEIERLLKENEDLNKDLLEKQKQLDIKEKALQTQENNLKEKKENLLSDVEETRSKLIEDAKKQIESALKDINKTSKEHELIEAKHRLNKLSEEEETVLPDDTFEFAINDNVRVIDLGIVGRIIKINKDKVEIISNDGLTIKTSKNRLEPALKGQPRRVRQTNADELIKIKSDVKLELNIIGYHVDEGVEAVAKYLDDARIRKFKTVRIIHGFGTGALRAAVHDYLDTCNFIEEYHYAGYSDGGQGATIVTLK